MTGPKPHTVSELLRAGEASRPALLDTDGGELAHEQLRLQVEALAGQLQATGVAPGERIAIVLPNGPAMAASFLATTSVGCAAPLNPRYTRDELAFYMEDLGTRFLITGPEGGDAAAAAEALGVRRLVIEGDLGSMAVTADPGGAKGSGDPGTSSGPAPGNDDVALLLHTSGTTSRPKIVPIRQRNLFASAHNIAASLEMTAADRSLNVMPLFHIHGLLAGLLAPLAAGGSVVCTPGFDAFRHLTLIEELGPTYYTAVPTMHQMVLARATRHSDRARDTGLRFVRSSSASLPGPVLDELESLFGVPVIEAYGMTEATHQMCSNPLPPRSSKPGSVGLATGIEVAVLDADDRPLPAGERGEVSIRGETVVDGYENNPEANASAFTSGWFRTGDEGYLDDESYLFLTGRLKEQINRGGEKISPLEVDEILLGHDAVAQAVTFAVPHAKLGEEVAAAVVLADGASCDEAQLRAHVAASLAAFKVPRQILFLDELPKGPTGKLQRIGLADRLGLTG